MYNTYTLTQERYKSMATEESFNESPHVGLGSRNGGNAEARASIPQKIRFTWMRGIVASIAAGALALTAAATLVSPEEAERAAAAWLKTGSALGRGLGSETDGAVAYVGKDGKGAFYVVKLKNADGASGGFVAVSADRRLNPVLAFFEGSTFEASEKSPVWAMLSTDAAGCAAALEKTDASGTSNGRLLAAGRKSTAERKLSLIHI